MLKVNRVVLYKHGIGYFERLGTVADNQTVELFFRAPEVSDVLKSLTAIDLDGGEVASISYDSVKPIEELLRDTSLNVPDSRSLLSLLPQLKGAHVTLDLGNTKITGLVVGIDEIPTHSADGIVMASMLTVLAEDGTLQSINLRKTKAVHILDQRLRKELEYYLTTTLSAKKRDVKKFTLFAQGNGERRLLVSYAITMPVWKATYRIILDGDQESTLQGWAVVDNTQDEDWEDVRLSLISGMPISFMHDLYTARYLRRPVVEVREEASIAPPEVEEAVAYAEEGVVFKARRDTREMMPMAAMAMAAPQPAAPTVRNLAAAISSMPARTSERAVGDLFAYDITTPVTIKRNQSALVPIVLKKFKGRAVLLYNEATRSRNPLTCVEMENTTGLTLEGGPVTVLEGDTYVGEAMLQTMKPEEQRLVPYSVELGVVADATLDSRQESTHRVRIINGTLEACYLDLRQKVYAFNNKTPNERMVYIEHPREQGWELFDTPIPVETTANFHRFKTTLAPNATSTFTVHERQERSHYYQLRNVTDAEVAFYIQQRYIDPTVAEVLQNVIGVKKQLADLEAEILRNEGEIRDIDADQKRIRENLQSLSDARGEQELRTRLVDKMLSQEDRLETLQKTISLQRAERITLQEKIAAAIADISLDVSLA